MSRGEGKLLLIVGARPNFIKIFPLIRAIEKANLANNGRRIEWSLVHTGQHFDRNMSEAFFDELGIPQPHYNLGVGSGTHAYQIGQTMIEFERVLLAEDPLGVVVVGDVNATVACSIVAKKYGIRVAHVEAGLRSFDWTMPEEINRIVTDRLSDLLFTPCQFSDSNLVAEGISFERIKRVGNIMIDAFEMCRSKFHGIDINRIVNSNSFRSDSSDKFNNDNFGVITLHRPSNVDSPSQLAILIDVFKELSKSLPLIFPIHPRTQGRLEEFGLWNRIKDSPHLITISPLGYLEMMRLVTGAKVVLTDSGGLQEETTFANIPCITMRENTERPVTLIENGGSNRLAGNHPDDIVAAFNEMLENKPVAHCPELWDGHTAERIVETLAEW